MPIFPQEASMAQDIFDSLGFGDEQFPKKPDVNLD